MAQIRWTPPTLRYTRRRPRIKISLSPPAASTYSETLTVGFVWVCANDVAETYQTHTTYSETPSDAVVTIRSNAVSESYLQGDHALLPRADADRSLAGRADVALALIPRPDN